MMSVWNEKIEALEEEIATLPKGYISKKTINGRIRRYLQWTEAGKKKSKYLNDETAAVVEEQIIHRRELEQELKLLKAQRPKARKVKKADTISHEFGTYVLEGENLAHFIRQVEGFRKRECYHRLEEYLESDPFGKVFILCGLRRTGKTTLIQQAIASMAKEDFDRTAFIRIQSGDTLATVNTDLKWLLENDYRYVFLDEVTLADDFIEGAGLFSDIYAASGMKIVLSGTDSLGFLFSESDELYDRCELLHTTHIPYKEFEEVLGISGIDEYIRYGGTMSLSGKHYNKTATFLSKDSTDEYIDSAIARNIQHSLKNYQYGGHFRHLAELYEKDELTSAVNRVIEDINHRFTVDVLTRDFISHDLGISAKNLRKDRENPSDILDHINKESFTEGLRNALEILNKSEQSIEITEAHRTEIKEYLDLLDLTVDIPVEQIPVKNERLFRTAIAQPGMRYAQAEALVRQLLLDASFQNISGRERARILDRVLNEIKGRMMEEIVLLETKNAFPGKDVFQLQFPVGEFDMVVVDPDAMTCEIYEIKHSTEAVSAQARFLSDREKCESVEFRFGIIMQKRVLYRGPATKEGDINYINVEDYLKSLP